jgi:hypothetical protein
MRGGSGGRAGAGQDADPNPAGCGQSASAAAGSAGDCGGQGPGQRWDGSQPPYPGLPAFTAAKAPVFFGRDGAINQVRERLESLAKRAPAFLLLLGASGYGKSSLVRAGVVPRLASDPSLGWLVLEPFSPGLFPFAALHRVLRQPLAAAEGTPPPVTVGADGEAAQLVRQLHWLRSVRQGPLRNMARSCFFSSDRSIRVYAETI